MNGALLEGAPRDGSSEDAQQHRRRFGPLPPVRDDFLAVLERSGLRGRGGAAFPVALKWRAVANGTGPPVVLVNCIEGEPLSHKDRLLLQTRPHLVIDGALIAAHALSASEIVFYAGAEHQQTTAALAGAIAERSDAGVQLRLICAPVRYVSGEETAAVHFVNDGAALPLSTPPRPYERGVDGRPTLVQNAETLAHVALIARHGDAWYRGLGRDGTPGTVLLTVNGAAQGTRVIEVQQGTTIGEAVNTAGGSGSELSAVLLGGFFGGWIDARAAWALRLDAAMLRDRGDSLGCGVLALLPAERCAVVETAGILSYLTAESARQCGPCVFGLRAIAAAAERVGGMSAVPADLERLQRWSGQLSGRGACKHPDGAAGLMASALRVFKDEFAMHIAHHTCTAVPALRMTA